VLLIFIKHYNPTKLCALAGIQDKIENETSEKNKASKLASKQAGRQAST